MIIETYFDDKYKKVNQLNATYVLEEVFNNEGLIRSRLLKLNNINKEIKKAKVYVKKGRIYILDPSEAPPGAQVHRGQYGGIYYESTRGRKVKPKIDKPTTIKPEPKKKPKIDKPEPKKKPIDNIDVRNAETTAKVITYNVDYTKASVEVANILNNHIINRMEKIGHKFKDKKLNSIIFEDMEDRTNAANDINSSNLYINSKRNTMEEWGKVWDDSKEYESRNGTAWTAGIHYDREEQLNFTLDHEMGHMIKDQLSKTELNKFNNVMNDAYNMRWRPISEYAMSSDDELFAELFAVYMNGNKEGYKGTNLLTDNMVKFFDDILRR